MRYLGLKIIMFSVMVLVLASGCGSGGDRGPAGVDAEPCLIEELEDGTYISCPDSDVFIPYPSDIPNEESPDLDEVVICKRGVGHTKHDHTNHEPCDD